jgi:hypothetical protein
MVSRREKRRKNLSHTEGLLKTNSLQPTANSFESKACNKPVISVY